MKKVLALVVAFALCFTAFTGCFATSAAALDNFAVSSVEVAADAQAATVTVSGTYTGKAVQLLSVTLPEGVALASVEGADELTDTQDGDYIVTGNVVKFLTVPNDAFTYKLNVTFAANTSETDAVAYEVVADVQYAFYDAENPTIETANAKGTITVAAVEKEEPEVPAEPEVDTNIDLRCNINLDATINVTYSVYKAGLSEDYDDFKIVVTRNKCNGSYDFDEISNEILKSECNVLSTRFAGLYTGVGMYELNVPITAVVYCYTEGVLVAKSNPLTVTVSSIAKELYDKQTATTEAVLKLKTLLVDLVNLGIEAQEHFANSNPDSQLASFPFATAIAEGTTTIGALSSIKNEKDYTETGITVSRYSPNLAANPALTYIINGLGGYSVDEFVVEISYANEKAGTTPTATLYGNQLNPMSNSRYAVLFDKIALYDLDKAITLKVYENDTKENLLYECQYSLETCISENYKADQVETSTYHALLKQIAIFSASAQAHFGT